MKEQIKVEITKDALLGAVKYSAGSKLTLPANLANQLIKKGLAKKQS